MSKNTRVAFIVAGIIIALGLCVFTLALACSGWDITKLGTTKFETNNHEITEDFTNIFIDTDTSDIIFLPSADGKCKVVCDEAKNQNHTVSVIDGTLTVKLVDTRKWYEYISLFSFGKRKITVYLPKTEYENLTVKTDTGDITILSVTCEGNIKIEVDTGKTVLSEVSCKNLSSDGDTGDISLTNVTVSERMQLERDTGDVKLDRIDASEMEITTDTGDVKGTVRSEKHFIAKSDTGRVRVPETGGNICRITTDTGDIIISIATE